MKRLFLILALLFSVVATASAQSSRAQSYQREAEYYQKRAENYRREAAYYLKKAEEYQREAAYYTKRGDIKSANIQRDYAKRAMNNYELQMRYAAEADEKAAMYLR